MCQMFARSQYTHIPVAKDTSNPTVIKLVLQGLAAQWIFNRESQLACRFDANLHHRTSSSLALRLDPASLMSEAHSPRNSHLSFADASAYVGAWEWKEGRFLAYELIFRLLITNHVHYLFPSVVEIEQDRNRRRTLFHHFARRFVCNLYDSSSASIAHRASEPPEEVRERIQRSTAYGISSSLSQSISYGLI